MGKIKKNLLLTIKGYCIICAIIVTLFFIINVILMVTNNGRSNIGSDFGVVYVNFLLKEYPKRGNLFNNSVMLLEMYSQKQTIKEIDVIKFFGSPDFVKETKDFKEFLYRKDDGIYVLIGFSDGRMAGWGHKQENTINQSYKKTRKVLLTDSVLPIQRVLDAHKKRNGEETVPVQAND